MAERKRNREQDSRKQDSRPSDSYVPAAQLPMPDPREGWEFHYVRTASLGRADVRNVSKRLREGWVPITLSEFPELAGETGDIGSNYPDGLEIGGLLLCMMSTGQVDARRKYYAGLAQRQKETVDEGFMNDHDPRMPKYNESKSRTQFRKG